MELCVKKENNEITFLVKDRITSDNYLELEKAFLAETDEYDKYILDLSELEYISSAGLRAILSQEKRLKAIGKYLTISGCSVATMDIFKVSGFSEILHFEEKNPIIDTDGLTIIGEGLCGKVYKVSDDTILKCYDLGFDISMIENEKKNARQALICGVPTAISLNMVKAKDGRIGILFEMLNAVSLKTVLRDDVKHLEEWVQKYVELVKTVHTSEGNLDEMNYALDQQEIEVEKCVYLTEEEKEKARKLLASLDRGHTCIHGDLHAGNVMVSNGELLFIDMSDFGIGHPYQDLAQIHNILENDVVPGFGKLMTGLEKPERHRIFMLFMKYYFNDPNEEEMKVLLAEIEKYEIAKHFFYINNFPSTRDPNIQYVKSYLAKL